MARACPAVALVLVLPGAVAPPATPAGGEPVAAVEVLSDADRLRAAEIRSLVEIEAGSPLSSGDVRRTLRNLHAVGVSSDVELYTENRPDGLVVAAVIWPEYEISEVRLEGDLGFKEPRLTSRLAVRAGDRLIEDRLLRSVFRLQDFYRERGYLAARVRLSVDTDDARKRAVVVFRITSGPPTTLATPGFEGDLGPLDAADLVAATKLEEGQRYRSRDIRDGRERLHGWLVDQRYRLARVDAPREVVSDENEVRLIFPIELGPRVDTEIRGASEKELRKRDLLPFLGREGYDQALVVQAAREITADYQRRGYYDVDVDWRERRTDDGLKVEIQVEPGVRYQLDEVRFTGNNAFAAETLEPLMETTPRRFLVPGSGRLVDETLDLDLRALRSFYQLQGFSEVQIAVPRVGREGESLSLEVPIEEGPRSWVVSLVLDGIDSLDPKAAGGLERALVLKPNGPYHPALVDQAVRQIRTGFEDAGYRYAAVEVSEDWNEDRTLVDLTLSIEAGPRSVVERRIIRGNRRTRPAVLDRLIELESGDPISRRKLLEVQRSLFRLGIFSRVDVQVAPGTPYTAERDVLVRLEEGAARRVRYGVGFDSEDGVRGVLGLTHRNLAGQGAAASLDLRASQRDQQYRAVFRRPYIGRWNTPVSASVFQVSEELDTFDSDRFGFQFELDKFFGPSRFRLIYGYEVVDLQATSDDPLDPNEVDRNLRDVEISSLSPGLLIDRRDDPIDPSDGWSTNLTLQYAFPVLGASADFVKLFGQQTYHRSFGRFGVLAASLRLGAIEPTGEEIQDSLVPAELPSSKIPVSERFFAGGRSTHRAYDRDQLGVPGETILDGTEIGGNGLALVNVELRVPIAGPFGATAFYDAGNVWADWRDLDYADVKHGAGVGVRYLTPIGPVRVEIGWKLDREPDEDPTAIFLSVGNAF